MVNLLETIPNIESQIGALVMMLHQLKSFAKTDDLRSMIAQGISMCFHFGPAKVAEALD